MESSGHFYLVHHQIMANSSVVSCWSHLFPFSRTIRENLLNWFIYIYFAVVVLFVFISLQWRYYDNRIKWVSNWLKQILMMLTPKIRIIDSNQIERYILVFLIRWNFVHFFYFISVTAVGCWIAFNFGLSNVQTSGHWCLQCKTISSHIRRGSNRFCIL